MTKQLLLDVDGVLNPLALVADVGHSDLWGDFKEGRFDSHDIYLSVSMAEAIKDLDAYVIMISARCDNKSELRRMLNAIDLEAHIAPMNGIWKNETVDAFHKDGLDRSVWIDDDEPVEPINEDKHDLLRITPDAMTGLTPADIEQAREFLATEPSLLKTT